MAPLGGGDSDVDLFYERAGLSRDADAKTRDDVRRLCTLLDGLPLAIELAAARTDVLSPGELATRLQRRLGLLRTKDPTLNPRQRSVHDTIDWGHQLLGPDEQVALRRLSILPGGFDLEVAASAVADDQIIPDDAAEFVWSLVSKSFIAVDPAAGSTRYRMLETIRSFARERLDAAGESADVATRVARFLVGLLGPCADGVKVTPFTERARELDNLRALIPATAPHDEELAQELAWTVVAEQRRAAPGSGYEEGLRLLERLRAPTPKRVGLLVEVTRLAVDRMLLDAATDLLDEADELAGRVGVPALLEGRIPQQRGFIAINRGHPELGREIVTAALEKATTPHARSRLSNLLAIVALEQQRFDEAIDAVIRARDLSVEIGDLESCAINASCRAEIELRAGDARSAAAHQLEALELGLELGSRRELTSAAIVAARLAADRGEWSCAVRLQTAADVLLAQIGLDLFPSDRELCDAVIRSATEELGPEYDEHLAAGRSLGIEDLIAETRHVLSTVADG